MTIKYPKLLFVLLTIFVFVVGYFYFVPAFAGRLAVAPDFYLGPLRLHWYGVILAAAVLLAYGLAVKFAPRFGLGPGFVDGLLPWLLLAGFVGARLYYVIFAWDFFRTEPNLIWQIWTGGLSIYGAVFGGAAALVIYAKLKRVAVWSGFGLLAAVLPLAQGLGRFGNFFNAEAFGAPTALPWKMYVPPMSRPAAQLFNDFFHPAFLYEALWDFGVFLILLYLMSRTSGLLAGSRVLGFYLILYSLGRFWIEGLRLDSFFIGVYRVDQLVALLMMLLGGAILIFGNHYDRQEKNN